MLDSRRVERRPDAVTMQFGVHDEERDRAVGIDRDGAREPALRVDAVAPAEDSAQTLGPRGPVLAERAVPQRDDRVRVLPRVERADGPSHS